MEVVAMIRIKTSEARNVFDLIDETTRRSVWNTGRAKRCRNKFMEDNNLTEGELQDLVVLARRHANKNGTEISIEARKYILLTALANFCYTL